MCDPGGRGPGDERLLDGRAEEVAGGLLVGEDAAVAGAY